MARSPYLEAMVNRWCREKKELVIEDCDLATFDIIVDYMYGAPIPESVVNSSSDEENSSLPKGLPHSTIPPFHQADTETILQYSARKLGKLAKLLQVSDKLLMVDLKGEVEELMIKILNKDDSKSWIHALMFVKLSDHLDCQKFLLICARLWCRHSVMKDVNMDKTFAIVKESPKCAAALLMAYAELH